MKVSNHQTKKKNDAMKVSNHQTKKNDAMEESNHQTKKIDAMKESNRQTKKNDAMKESSRQTAKQCKRGHRCRHRFDGKSIQRDRLSASVRHASELSSASSYRRTSQTIGCAASFAISHANVPSPTLGTEPTQCASVLHSCTEMADYLRPSAFCFACSAYIAPARNG